MQLHAQPVPLRRFENLAAFGTAEDAGFAEHIAAARELFADDDRDHFLTYQPDVVGSPAAVLGRHFVSAEKCWDERGRQHLAEPLDHAELLQLGFQLEAVAGFHFDRRRAAREQRLESRARERRELRFRSAADIAHRFEDAAAGRGDGLVIEAQRAAFVIVQAGRAEDAVRVTIDEAGKQDTGKLDRSYGRSMLRPDRRFPTRAHPRDAIPIDQDCGVRQDLRVRHLAPAACARRPPARHHLPRADEQCLQSGVLPSIIGRRRWWRRAVAIASGYPASAWRATPMPGSLVSTRSRRLPAAGVPSATMTCPAWRELPMP